MLELRTIGNLTGSGKRLKGHAAIFNTEADLGDFVEVIRNGAFRKSLNSGSNIRALFDHDGSALLGTTKGGTLQLREDAQGLAFELELPDTSHGRDVAVLVERGDLAQCSFGFRIPPGGDKWEQRGKQMVRELLTIDLSEITLTANPAYADTSVAMRSLNGQRRTEYLGNPSVHMLWLETCK